MNGTLKFGETAKGDNLELNGTLKSEGTIELTGKIEINGNYVGYNLVADEIEIYGTMRCDEANARFIRVGNGSNVKGTITADKVIVERNARVEIIIANEVEVDSRARIKQIQAEVFNIDPKARVTEVIEITKE